MLFEELAVNTAVNIDITKKHGFPASSAGRLLEREASMGMHGSVEGSRSAIQVLTRMQ